MAEMTLREIVARLGAQDREIVDLRARLANAERRQRRATGPRRRGGALAVALLVALVPLSLLAATPFTDLTDGSPHNGDIELIYDAGVTKGCVPDAEYCPTRNVTREEMASFLARLGGLGTNPPVANANTLQGYAPSGLIRVARAVGTNKGGSEFVITASTPTYQQLPGAVVAIEAPGSGFVLVTGSLNVTSFQQSTVLARLRDVTPGAPEGAGTPEISRRDTGDFGSGALSQTYVFPVSGAGTKTFQIEVAIAGASFEPKAYNGVITALFIPFGSGGGGTLDLP